MNNRIIPHFGLARQYKSLKKELQDATHNVLSSGQWVGGHYTRAFEEWLKYYTGVRYVVTVHSGTQALEIIARHALADHKTLYGVESAKVRIPNLTYPATLTAFITAGWDVELVDTDRNGIVPPEDSDDGVFNCIVGLYGAQPAPLMSRPDTYLDIVDGAQHWLVANREIGRAMAVSFDPTKNLPSSGNGGAILTDHIDIANYASNYRNNGSPSFNSTGTNSKMSEQDCAHILVRAEYIKVWQARRTHIANFWCDRFRNLPLRCLSDGVRQHAHQKFVVYLPDRAALNDHLTGRNIECKVHYPYTLGELQIAESFVKPDMLSTSMMLSRGVLSLPMYPELTDTEVEYIATSVIQFFDK